jgi:hypothetical protein
MLKSVSVSFNRPERVTKELVDAAKALRSVGLKWGDDCQNGFLARCHALQTADQTRIVPGDFPVAASIQNEPHASRTRDVADFRRWNINAQVQAIPRHACLVQPVSCQVVPDTGDARGEADRDPGSPTPRDLR